ncbi:MAG: rhodanese-like domain-containing protein [Candidatus Protochlamydia sp.]|nr:rhodanese-like domain-containing protein [Candidatus Protochlamydia sp.]
MKNFALIITAICAVNCLQAHVAMPHTSSATENETDARPSYKEVNTLELKKMIESHPSLVIIDARPSKRFATHIPDAKSLPYDSADALINSTLPDKNAPIVVYCISKECPVSGTLAEKLVHRGYSNVFKYPDGIAGWEDSGNQVETIKTIEAAK